MGKLVDLIGHKYGRLEVLGRSENSKHGDSRWECKCDCGKVTTVTSGNLKNGRIKSCGCYRRDVGSVAIDLTGLKIGRLTVIKRVLNDKNNHPQYICKCDCGNEKIITGTSLRMTNTVSCGCYKKEYNLVMNKTHGYSYKSEYRSWSNMIQRCTNKNFDRYKDYGGRGITVCERWAKFENFIEDMGNKPSNSYSIDRVDVNGNYEPSNCKWSTIKEQNINKRKKKVIQG